MRESELKLEHSIDSAALIHDIRAVLNSASEGQAEWSRTVVPLINRIDDILRYTPDANVPAEWRIMAAVTSCFWPVRLLVWRLPKVVKVT